MEKKKLIGAITPILLAASVVASAQMATEAKESGQRYNLGGTGTILFDQTGLPSVNGAPDQNFEAAFDAYDSFAADDFVVDGDGWSITQVDTIGTASNPAPDNVADSISISFHADIAGAPDPVAIVDCEYTDLPITAQIDGSFTVNLTSPCDLTPGTYWVAMQTNQEFAVSGQHFWSSTQTVSGSEAHWLNPGDGFGSGCTTWSPGGSVCGVADGGNGAFLSYDHLFSLTGTLLEDTDLIFANGFEAIPLSQN